MIGARRRVAVGATDCHGGNGRRGARFPVANRLAMTES